MRVFSIFSLVLILVVRSEEDHPSLPVEKENWEKEKFALQKEADELRKNLEDTKSKLVKSSQKIQECEAKSEAWIKAVDDGKSKQSEYKASLRDLREKLTNQEKHVATMKESEDILNLKFKQQNSLFTEERKTLENKIAQLSADAITLKEQLTINIKESKKTQQDHESKSKEMETLIAGQAKKIEEFQRRKESTGSELLTEKETISSRLTQLEATVESKSRELESVSTELSVKKNQIASNANEFEVVRNELRETKLKFEELRSQNVNAVKERELIASKCEEETAVLNLKWEEDLARLNVDLMSMRVKLDDEKASLEREANLLKEEIKNLTVSASNVEGDIFLGGSWLQVPRGWNGRLALDLRLLRSM